MPEWIEESLKYIGPFGVFCIAMLYLVMRDRANRRPVGGNPGPPLVNGRWQQEMRDSQRQATETLGRIEVNTAETARLLNVLWGRLGGDPPP